MFIVLCSLRIKYVPTIHGLKQIKCVPKKINLVLCYTECEIYQTKEGKKKKEKPKQNEDNEDGNKKKNIARRLSASLRWKHLQVFIGM